MTDARTGLVHRYTGKDDLLAEGLVGWRASPEDLWNAAEGAEKRKDARTARELRIALPAELPPDVLRALAHGYCCNLRDELGVAMQWAIHAPEPHRTKKGEVARLRRAHRDGTDDGAYHEALRDPKMTNRNFHLHVILTTREVYDHGQFGQKTRSLDAKKSGFEVVERMRAQWTRRVNAALEKSGTDRRVDLRSYERQAAEGGAPEGMIPQTHLGPRETAIGRKIAEEANVLPRRDILRNELVRHHNETLWTDWIMLRALRREQARAEGASAREAQDREDARRARAEAEKRRIAAARTEVERAAAIERAASIDAPRSSIPVADVPNGQAKRRTRIGQDVRPTTRERQANAGAERITADAPGEEMPTLAGREHGYERAIADAQAIADAEAEAEAEAERHVDSERVRRSDPSEGRAVSEAPKHGPSTAEDFKTVIDPETYSDLAPQTPPSERLRVLRIGPPQRVRTLDDG